MIGESAKGLSESGERASRRGLLRRLCRDRRGAVAMYVAFFSVLFVGGGVFAIDVGRLAVARAELQNAADSAALSGAVFLDGSAGAIDRATEAADQAILNLTSRVVEAGNFDIATYTFYSVYDRDDAAAQITTTEDMSAGYIQVDLRTETVSILLQPIVNILAAQDVAGEVDMETTAVAEYRPISCDNAPLMVCYDPSESTNVLDPDNIGRTYTLKQAPGSPLDVAAGNFGLLDAGSGADAILDALADPSNFESCAGGEGDGDIATEPGSKTQKVVEGINARFGGTPELFKGSYKWKGTTNPATNAMNHPRDVTMVGYSTGEIGDGDWQPNIYFNTVHQLNVTQLPPRAIPEVIYDVYNAAGAFAWDPINERFTKGSIHFPTRYQTYLWEIGTTFYINTVNGGSAFPNVPDSGAWSAVDSTPHDDFSTYTTDLAEFIGGGAGETYDDFTYLVPDTVVDGATESRVPDENMTRVIGTMNYANDDEIRVGGQIQEGQSNGTEFNNYCEGDISKAECQVRHRTTLVVAVNCEALDLAGKAAITGVVRFVRFFILKRSEVPGAGQEASIHGELVGVESELGLGGTIASPAIIGNVRLVN